MKCQKNLIDFRADIERIVGEWRFGNWNPFCFAMPSQVNFPEIPTQYATNLKFFI